MLNSSGDNGHHCLVPDINGKDFNLFTIHYGLAKFSLHILNI